MFCSTTKSHTCNQIQLWRDLLLPHMQQMKPGSFSSFTVVQTHPAAAYSNWASLKHLLQYKSFVAFSNFSHKRVPLFSSSIKYQLVLLAHGLEPASIFSSFVIRPWLSFAGNTSPQRYRNRCCSCGDSSSHPVLFVGVSEYFVCPQAMCRLRRRKT